MQCPKCGAEVPGSDYICGACGAYAGGAGTAVAEEVAVGSGGATPHPSLVVPHPHPAPAVRQPPLGYPTGSEGPDYAHPTMHGWPGLAPPDAPRDLSVVRRELPHMERIPPEGLALGMDQSSLETLLALQVRKSAKRWARWSLVLAALALVFPVFFGPVGFATGYIAWRLGEKRLGRIGAALSAIGMIVGILLAVVVLSHRPQS